MTVCRGVRGATTVVENNALEILAATRELLAMMIRLNGIEAEDVASGIFTTTQDLVAVYPATAARQLGWMSVPLLCGHEMAVPDGLPRCVRILLHWNTDRSQDEIHHVYLKEAVQLRPDQSELPPVNMQQLNQWVDDQMRRHGGA
ncbi:MAG: chorismate mutase [Caldilineaceae bacterium SB0666_bin_21]|nr:chorismate mutase [Caldilineaceae bacterium SB0665_bin_21]MXZ40889.1 chorismate mutase [Caldilineaceae bacterium SB0666_bin_21]MYA04173.1 chorismate mutase [Caldilineaceae bacterium SB0664_bin_22]MYC61329.1 chorismate mutase [Caldilineaceae bacterium SB0661_bin_34]